MKHGLLYEIPHASRLTRQQRADYDGEGGAAGDEMSNLRLKREGTEGLKLKGK